MVDSVKNAVAHLSLDLSKKRKRYPAWALTKKQSQASKKLADHLVLCANASDNSFTTAK